MREFLLISYLYPPIFNSGTRHVTRFTRHLPDLSYKPIILTSGTRGELATDAENEVHRTGEVFGTLKRLYRANYLRKLPDNSAANITLTPKSGIGHLLRQWVIPDLQIPWYPLALQRGRALVKSKPIQLLYSTSGPETNHLVALQLKRESGLPWVADFRDGWLFEPLVMARSEIKLRNSIEARLERSVVRHADKITILNQRMAEDLRTRYPEAAHKVIVNSNGFDASEFSAIERTPTGKFTLVHTGSLSLSRPGTTIQGLLEALTRLKRENHPILHDIEIVMVGKLTEDEIQAIRAVGDASLFRLVEQVEHSAALQYQVNAEALLLITHPTELAISTTKLFEYLGAGRPIFALTPSGSSAANIIRETQTGVITPPDDIDQIYASLLALYAQWQRSELSLPASASVSQYEYHTLSAQLAAIFDETISEAT